MAVPEYRTGGKRYYVIEVTGWAINPHADESGSREPSKTYAVLDRDWNHREVTTFVGRNGRPSAWCKRKADELAAELNRADEAERHRDRRAALKAAS